MSTRAEISLERSVNDHNILPLVEDGNKVGKQAKSNMPPNQPKKSPKDFKFGKLIGEGSFSIVYLAKDIHNNKEYAIKVCDKRHILKEKKEKAIMREKVIMNLLNNHPSPFFIRLYCTFQDPERLYFVMNYAKRGELLPYIDKVGSFDEECTKFYSAELILALEHLHKLNIIHRDLKPENILLNEGMHIQITDFGSAKVLTPEDLADSHRRNSFVGTAQYVSPEMLTDKITSTGHKNNPVYHGVEVECQGARVPLPRISCDSASLFSCDLWALGCIIYQMVSGLPPFRASNEYLIFQKITKLEYEFPDGFLSLAKDLVQQLLVLDPSNRLGAKGSYNCLQSHPFFAGFNWNNLDQQVPPRILPYLPGTSNNEELRSEYQVPDHLEPGLDEKQMTRLLGLALQDDEVEAPAVTTSSSTASSSKTAESAASTEKSTPKQRISTTEPPILSMNIDPTASAKSKRLSILVIDSREFERRVAIQCQENPWHKFVQNNLILKQGFVDKRKGLFTRRRMLLLTTGLNGPRFFYVDPVSRELKGQIPWSADLRAEPKNFKTFFVHTPKRTYYLEDPEGYSLEWCRVIDQVLKVTYSSQS